MKAKKGTIFRVNKINVVNGNLICRVEKTTWKAAEKVRETWDRKREQGEMIVLLRIEPESEGSAVSILSQTFAVVVLHPRFEG